MVYDFHTHTSLSDSALSPIELIRWAMVAGYRAIALTDHSGLGSLERIIKEITEDCNLANAHWNIVAIPGIELTHLPPPAIAERARRAKELGAKIVIVHGETIIEPVEKGTNLAAVQSPDVDILAHPGLPTLEEAKLAAKNGIFLEITSRKGHCLTNGYITHLARKTGAKLLLNSDAHQEDELLTPALTASIALGAGLDRNELHQLLATNPFALLERLSLSSPK